MRWLALLALAGCSFEHGTANDRLGDSAGSADAPHDASRDAPAMKMDAPDAAPRTCPANYITLTGAPTSSKYRVFNWDNATSQNQSQPWNTAKQTCITDGTHLAIPNDMAELTALRQAIAVDPQSNYFWIGDTDQAVEGTWLDVLGNSNPYLPWAPGQPNNGGGPGGSGMEEDCAMATPANATVYDWICGTPYPFACECE